MKDVFARVGQSIRDNSVIVSFICYMFSNEAGTPNDVEYPDLETKTHASTPQERHHN